MKDLNEYIKQMFSWDNPIIYAFLFGIIILGVILFIAFRVIFPMRSRFKSQRRELILRQTKLMALFAELDPDPLLRIDNQGRITQSNDAARSLFKNTDIKNAVYSDLLKKSDLNIDEIILNQSEIKYVENIGGRIFSVTIKGDSGLKFANIYLRDITTLKKYEFELEEYKNNLKILAGRLEQKYETERNYISSELHDDLGQRLILINNKLAGTKKEKLDEVITDINDVYQRIREISHMLKPPEIEDFGINFAIKTLVTRISKGARIEGDYSFIGEDERFSPELEMSLYRSAQEALNNILKHSHASEFSVQMINKESEINLIISDNGIGIPYEYFSTGNIKNSGIGLFNMKERLGNLKGNLKVQSSPGEGTTLFIQIPKQIIYENNKITNS